LDSKKDDTAVSRSDMYITTKSGQQRMHQSTVRWKLLIQWTNGTQEWIPLKLLKEAYPVEVAEFAIATGIDLEPAFAYWIKQTLKKGTQSSQLLKPESLT
jgi:urease accessory protein UreF